jgi:hypothetical protein
VSETALPTLKVRASEAANLVDVLPRIRTVHDVALPRGRGTLTLFEFG